MKEIKVGDFVSIKEAWFKHCFDGRGGWDHWEKVENKFKVTRMYPNDPRIALLDLEAARPGYGREHGTFTYNLIKKQKVLVLMEE